MGKSKFGKVSQESALPKNGSQQMCNHLALEEAVCHFIINHQMDEMIGDSGGLKRQTDMVRRGFDFESEELCIEMKVFLSKANAKYESLRERFRHSVEQMVSCISGFSEAGTDGRRIILLVVGQQGICKDIRTLTSRENRNLLEKAADMGMEFWVAEVEAESEAGMELLSYKNITNEMRGGMGNG